MIKNVIKLILILVLAFSGFYYFNNREDVNYFLTGEMYNTKVYHSPDGKNQFTVLIYTKGWFDYYTNIYIIDGIYSKRCLPKDGFAEFPNGTGILIKWISNDSCVIISDEQPTKNMMKTSNYTLRINVDERKIRFLRGKGIVIRYNFKPKKINN